MDKTTAIALAAAAVYIFIAGFILVAFSTICSIPFIVLPAVTRRIINRQPSYYRSPRYNPSDLEIQSLSDGPSRPAQLYLATDRISATNAARRKLQRLVLPVSLSVASLKKPFNKAVAYPRKTYNRIRRKPDPSGGPDGAVLPSYEEVVIPLEDHSPPGSPVEFSPPNDDGTDESYPADDDGTESVMTLPRYTITDVLSEEEPAADDVSEITSLSPTLRNSGAGPVWV